MKDEKPDATRPKYWWFQGASVAHLSARLLAANPATARLEIRIDANDRAWLRVRSDGARVLNDGVTDASSADASPDACGDIDDSHVCPPQC